MAKGGLGRLAALVVAGLAVFMLVSVTALVWLDYTVTHRQTASLGGPFTLVDTNGHTVSDKDFRGRYMLLYFGYTSCPDICPTTMADLVIAMRKLGAKADRMQPIFVTVDPGRDTPAVMKDYVSAFSPRLVGLTGTPAEIGAVEKEYRVYAKIEKTGDGPDGYTVDHSSAYYLVGPDGHFVAVLRADQEGDTLAHTLAGYL